MTDPGLVAGLVKVRKLAADEAHRELLDRLRREDDAEQALRQAIEAIATQADAAADLSADDLVVEAFGAWLPQARARRRHAEAALARAGAETAMARAALTAARAAAEAAAELQDALLAARRAERARAEQHELDDLSRPRPNAPDGETAPPEGSASG
jgi:hypothetical protein